MYKHGKKILGERARLQWQYNNAKVWSILLGNGENIVKSFDQQAMQSNKVQKTKRVATKQEQSIYKSIMRREWKEERKEIKRERIHANVLQIESPSRRWLMVGLANTNRSRISYCEFAGARWQLH
jgi:hypothetical protein